MSAETTDPVEVIRRRVRVLSLLQSAPISRYDVATKLIVTDKTIQRDIEWLRDRGVPVTSEQANQYAKSLWSVARKFNAKKWLWFLMQ